jgi:hypothetical protein
MGHPAIYDPRELAGKILKLVSSFRMRLSLLSADDKGSSRLT